MLPSAKKDSVPTTQKSCVVYEFSCRCEARYVGRTTQRLADRIKQHVPTSIRTKNTVTRKQPPRMCKNSNSKMKSESAIGQHLFANPECAKTYTDDNFRIIGQARSSFHLSVLESVYIKTQNPILCKQKEFVFHLDSSSKQWRIGANWPIIGPNRRIIHHITCTRIWLYISVLYEIVTPNVLVTLNYFLWRFLCFCFLLLLRANCVYQLAVNRMTMIREEVTDGWAYL